MRVSEVLNLPCEHLDWAAGFITVHETKFAKTRLVPLHRSSVVALADYKRRQRKYLAKYGYGPVSHVFASRRGRRVHATSLDRIFWELSHQIGLRVQSGGHGPRMHDLRHRFAVESLLRGYPLFDHVRRQALRLLSSEATKPLPVNPVFGPLIRGSFNLPNAPLAATRFGHL